MYLGRRNEQNIAQKLKHFVITFPAKFSELKQDYGYSRFLPKPVVQYRTFRQLVQPAKIPYDNTTDHFKAGAYLCNRLKLLYARLQIWGFEMASGVLS
jgi:hypothetical protein